MAATSSPWAFQDLRIARFIVHIVDHKTLELALSGLETPIDAASHFPHEFFNQYIKQALASPQRRNARFRAPGGTVSLAFSALTASPQSFVGESQRIARHLYQVMRDSRYAALIKPGDLMVALCQDAAQAGEDGPRYLAILKIDPSDAVLRRVDQVGGQQRVSFETREDRVPEAQENKIQKIAVVGPRQPTPEPFDLVILDNNIAELNVAHFFYDDFLECWLNRDPAEVTEFLLREVKSFVSRPPVAVAPSLPPDVGRSIVERSAAVLEKGTPVILDDFAEQVSRVSSLTAPEAEAVHAALVAHLTSRGRPEERIASAESVAIDAVAAAAGSKTATYVLDGGIKIRGDAVQMNERVKISPRNAAGKVKITITTQIFGFR